MGNNTFDSFATELCDAAETIKNNKILWLVLAFELLLFTVAILFCCVFLYLIYRHAYIHINARLLLANLTFNVLLTAIANITQVTFAFFKFARYSWCDLLESYDDCRRKFLPELMIEHATVLSVFALIVERACATIFARTYEKKITKKIVIAFIALEWFAVFGYTIFMVTTSSIWKQSNNGSEDRLVFTCKVGFTQPETPITSHVAATLVYAIFLLILVGIIVLNRYKYSVAYVNRKMHSLSERYQLHENVRGTRLLLPGVAMQCVMSLSGVIVLVVVDNQFRSVVDQTERIVLLYPIYEWINLQIAVCTLLYPLLSTVFSSVLAKAVWDMINCRKQQKRLIVQQNTATEKENAYTKQGAFKPIPMPAVSRSTQKHFSKLTASWEKMFHSQNIVAPVSDSQADTMSTTVI